MSMGWRGHSSFTAGGMYAFKMKYALVSDTPRINGVVQHASWRVYSRGILAADAAERFTLLTRRPLPWYRSFT